MSLARGRGVLLPGIVLVTALGTAAAVDRWAPDPVAAVDRGTEEPFAVGLHPRELPPRGAPLRWTRPRTLFRFQNLPSGPALLDVAIHGQRSPVAVAADGVVTGVLEPGAPGMTFAVEVRGGNLEVELRTPGFQAGDGRTLGALLDRVTVRHARRAVPAPGLALLFVIPALAWLAAARVSGMAAPLATAGGVLVVLLEAAALWPGGIVRSSYAVSLAAALVLGGVAAAGLARSAARRQPGSQAFAFGAFLCAFAVQGVAATSPVMVVSDVMFHANKLTAVAAGDWFPTSVTQHTPPFRIPYGVSFYACLAPLVRRGADPAWLVRLGAAAAGLLASVVLFRLALPGGALRAGLATVLLQILPGAFDVPYSHGNLSNGFGQAMTAVFFAWWAGTMPGGWPVGALTFALAGLGHLSSLIVLVVLSAGLVAARRATLRHDRPRLAALAAGALVVSAYYARFLPLVRDQLPRLLEGTGRGPGGGGHGVADVLMLQAARAFEQWGLPAILLALAGVLLHRQAGDTPDRDVAAFWAAGAVLAAVAVVSPLEVRYLYALTLPLALAAADGAARLLAAGGWRRGLALVALAAQAVLAARNVVEAVLFRYRG